jgi:hypothetical protein
MLRKMCWVLVAGCAIAMGFTKGAMAQTPATLPTPQPRVVTGSTTLLSGQVQTTAPATRYTADHTAPYQYARYYGRSLYRPWIYRPNYSYWYGYPYNYSYPYGGTYYSYRAYNYSYPWLGHGNWANAGYYSYPYYASYPYYGTWGGGAPYYGSYSYMMPSYASYYAPSAYTTGWGYGGYPYYGGYSCGYRGCYGGRGGYWSSYYW